MFLPIINGAIRYTGVNIYRKERKCTVIYFMYNIFLRKKLLS
jgi:hypothetical protein